MKKIFIIMFLITLVLSCNKKSNISTENKPQNNIENEVIIEQDVITETKNVIKPFKINRTFELASLEEKEKMKTFLYENDNNIIKYNLEILFIEKANFGITDGVNWIVRLSDRDIVIYAIENNIIKKRYFGISFNLSENSTFDIMKNIPGTHIGNSTSSFGDFNGDGIDEIFRYGFGGNGNFIIINGYNEEDDDFFNNFYCSIPFAIIDPENGPAPIEFINYNGMSGFKAYLVHTEVAGGPNYISEPNPNSHKWFFYTWDNAQKKYINVGEVVD